MLNYHEIIDMFNLEGDKVYFSNKGKVSADEIIITEDYTWNDCDRCMLDGSEFTTFIVLREGKELSEEEYYNFRFQCNDKSGRINESGIKTRKHLSYNYTNKGVDLSGCEVYILYNNYNNNNLESYNVDIYTIK